MTDFPEELRASALFLNDLVGMHDAQFDIKNNLWCRAANELERMYLLVWIIYEIRESDLKAARKELADRIALTTDQKKIDQWPITPEELKG